MKDRSETNARDITRIQKSQGKKILHQTIEAGWESFGITEKGDVRVAPILQDDKPYLDIRRFVSLASGPIPTPRGLMVPLICALPLARLIERKALEFQSTLDGKS